MCIASVGIVYLSPIQIALSSKINYKQDFFNVNIACLLTDAISSIIENNYNDTTNGNDIMYTGRLTNIN